MKKRFLSLAVAFLLLGQIVPAGAAEQGGVSVWAVPEVEAADRLGLIVPSCATDMTHDITRQQFAELAVNLVAVKTGLTIDPAPADTFSDCDDLAVRYAYALGIVNGVGDGRFAPQDGLTREQLAAMLHRAWGLFGAPVPSAGLGGYTDTDAVSTWAVQAVGSLAAAGVMKGTSDATLTPQGPCTVEQSVLLVYRLYCYQAESRTSEADPITIDMRNPGKHREPREGDTVIRPDGTSVVLKRDETFGILGWGQNVGPWLGTEVAGLDASGKEFTVDTGHYIAGPVCDDSKWQEDLAGGWYMKCDAPGYEYEYHWSGEWTHIKTETSPNKAGIVGVDGQYDSTGLWMYCADAAIPGWIWQGPNNV